MPQKFEDVQVGDQLEMPRSRGAKVWGAPDGYDPNQIVQVGIVTDRWYDPVDAKEYVGVSILRKGGEYGKPTRKHTIRGLASNGWQPATKDWIAWATEMDAAVNGGQIIPINKTKPA